MGYLMWARFMKVNNYQIEVMWLILATMFCRVTSDNEVKYTYSNEVIEFINNPSFNIRKIRPPPGGGV